MADIQDYLNVAGRIATVIPLFIAVGLVMGKRHLGELSVFDLVIAVTLGSVAGADLADPEIPHGPTVMTILLLGLMHQVISRIVLQHRKIGKLVTFDPTVVMDRGVILHEHLAKIRYSTDELLSQLRAKDIFDLNEVDSAVLEPHGALSVQRQPQPQQEALSPSQQGLGLPVPVVLEGRVHEPGLRSAGRDRVWLNRELAARGYQRADQVFLAMADRLGGLYVSPMAVPGPEARLSH